MDDYEDTFRKLSAGAVFKKSKPTRPKTIESEDVEKSSTQPKIKAVGDNASAPIDSFEELAQKFNLSETLLQNIKKCGYDEPTPIQSQAIPVMLEKKQILACAPTGSGKTASFLIPIIHHLGKPKNVGFRAVIVSPTRELSRQTYRECMRLSEGFHLRVFVTKKMKDTTAKSASDITNKYDILITTPNRLIYLLQEETCTISLKKVEWLIIDESDKLFETGVRGFRDQLAVIYQACDAENIKRAMFSATNTVELTRWCKKNLNNLVTIAVGHRNTTVENIEQKLVYVGTEEGKIIGMRDIIREGIQPPVLIFVQSKDRARELFNELLYDGINVDIIHSERTQKQRDNTVRAFREGKIWVLICTELMGRGIDFKGVNLVINYDFPPTGISYIHRIGRTGRAGRQGKAITFYTDEDRPYLKSVVNVMTKSGCEVPPFLLTLKKPHKKTLEKLATRLPKRKDIADKPHRYKPYLKKEKQKEKEKEKQKEEQKK